MRSTLTRRSLIAAACSAITPSRAAHPAQASAGGRLVTSHHDHDIRTVIKPPRWVGSAKIATTPGSHAATANAARPHRS